MSFLQIIDAQIGYKFPLIKHVNTCAELGQLILIIGDNGIGKTTLINSLLGQIPLLQGQINIDQKNIAKQSSQDIAQKIAIVFSKTNTSPHLTTEDLISLGKYIHYPFYFKLKEEDKKKVQSIIDDLQLQPYQHLPLNHLSDGNLQKAFIGRALAQNSPCIILDEPTTHLDETNKIAVLKLLRRIAKTYNKLIILSSHDWRLAKEFADLIWYIKDKTLYSGITEDILTQHRELTKTHLFEFHPNFVAPKIIAPNLEAEMLYSFLQKNSEKDLSQFTFSYITNNWEISNHNFQAKAQNFTQILEILKNIH